MKKVVLTLWFVIAFIITGCGSAALLPVTVDFLKPLDGYKYFYMTPTGDKTGKTGYVYGYGSGVTYGSSKEKSTNPADVISGFLFKKGYIRVPDVPGQYPDQTFIISYGESGKRDLGAFNGFTLEVTLQFISATTNEVLCTVTGEGKGSTEADDIRIAINRCLQEVFGE